MLEECALPYNVIPVNLSKGEQFKSEFLSITPDNRMPVMVGPRRAGRPFDLNLRSGAILQYLGRNTGRSIRATSAAASWSIREQDINQFPRLKRWLERVLARPAPRSRDTYSDRRGMTSAAQCYWW